MKRLYRDMGRSLLVILLVACAAAIAGLGATVHVFTLQQTQEVEDSTVTLAVRHTGSFDGVSYYLDNDAKLIDALNAHESVKVPALTKPYAARDVSVTPVYSGQVEGAYYSWSRDVDHAYTVMTVTCEKLLDQRGYALVRVDEVHLSLPYDIPEKIRVTGYLERDIDFTPGQSYLICGRYEDYFVNLDVDASLIKGYYDPVYKQMKDEPPLLRLYDWWDMDPWMKYASTPDDTPWRHAAVRIGSMNNRMLRLNCINDLERLAWFNNGTASIVEGRAFTEEEQASGAKVCLISQELAKANRLSIGDTISMTAYVPSIRLNLWAQEDMLEEQYTFTDVDNAANEKVVLEIVGIYTAPLYTSTIDEFTPDTVFAPYDAVSLEMNRTFCRYPIHTQNIILHNGQGDAFLQAVKDAGYPDGIYTIEETNYDEVKEILALMIADSITLLAVSVAVGVLMLVIILALYARSWRKENAILAMLGTGRMRVTLRMLLCCVLLVMAGCGLALLVVSGAREYVSIALNEVYITASMDFSAIRVGAFSEEGMRVELLPILIAMGMTCCVFLLVTAVQSVVFTRRKVNQCLFD
ncbi:MAG: hypothetical protein IJ438_03110 [Clostridia bacterium]|nr:hypothetical protein [Clostridia bacterium]